MKKYALLAISIVALMAGCKGNKTEKGDVTTTDSLAQDSLIEVIDTTPPPAFLYYTSPDTMTVLYWTSVEMPEFEDDNEYKESNDAARNSWIIQDRIRRNADTYKTLYYGNESTAVKFIGEELKNPDGKDWAVGQIHNRWNRGAGLDYAFVKPDKKITESDDLGGFCVLASDIYLKTHKPLTSELLNPFDVEKPMPKNILTLLSKKYDLKVDRSTQDYLIDNRYIYGVVQFKPKGDKIMALDVIYDKQKEKVYVNEEEANYDPSETYSIWNVDDEGTYYSSVILKAFEGPRGLELCFVRSAPESMTIGYMNLKGDKIIRTIYDAFYVYIDEPKPLWKKDFDKLVKLFLEEDAENKYVKLTRWLYVSIDNDDDDEVWLSDKEGKNHAFFTMKDNKPKLICTAMGKLTPTLYYGRICIGGPAGGPSWYYENYILENSRVVHKYTKMEIYGEFSEAHLDGQELGKAAAEEFEAELFDQKHYMNDPSWWNSIDEEN